MIVVVLLRLTEVQTADCSCSRVATGSAATQTAYTHMHKRTTQQILGKLCEKKDKDIPPKH